MNKTRTARVIPNVLTIAGSDSSGGAGIQADIKTFTALNVYGASVITAVTAQNTTGVKEVYPLAPDIVKTQLKTCLEDIRFSAIKIGMLHNSALIHAIADILEEHLAASDNIIPVVIDPVLVSSSGRALLEKESLTALITRLFPLASLITPNLPEGKRIMDELIKGKQSLYNEPDLIAHYLHSELDVNILLKGGHCEEANTNTSNILTDRLATPIGITNFRHKKINTSNTHGTGCTLSSAIAAQLAFGLELEQACKHGIEFLHRAICHAEDLSVGENYGPVNHMADLLD